MKRAEYIAEKVLLQNEYEKRVLARRLSDNRKVEIKTVAEKTHFLNSLHDEFEIARKLHHENIISYVDLTQFEGKNAIIIEHVDSTKLANVIPSTGFEVDTFLKIAIQLAEALREIHQNSIVHQYINDESILIDRKTLSVTLSDFSVASYNTHLIKADISNFKRKLPYISPEQTGRMNRYIDYRTDFYSLGIVFYQLLIGTVPFYSEDSLELVHWHVAQKALPLRQVKKSVPMLVSDIILKLLSKDCSDRYQSAEGLLSDLHYCHNNKRGSDSSYRVGHKDHSNTFSIPQKLYGRAKELEILHAKFNQVVRGDTVTLMVTGYSGIGKSAVINELQKEILIKNAYFAMGKYEHQKKNVSYSAIGTVFSDLIRQILGESDKRVAIWKKSLQKAVGDNGQVIIDIVPELELIIGKQQPVLPLGITESRNRFNIVFQKFVAVFDELAHPLVIFLDDLQWIDLASLSLIKLLVSEHLTKSFLFIGAYRSNEVDDSHPVSTTIIDIENSGVEIEYIHLTSLSLTSINRWIADTLQQELKETQSLSELVIEKTGGNPFFVKSFLYSLYAENLIRFSDKHTWQWDLDEIITMQPTDNVTELMVRNIERLPQKSQYILTLASCIGTNFNVTTLGIISELATLEVESALKPVLASGMIIRQKSEYKFIHDKILEAAYSVIPKEKIAEIHLQTGRRLYSHLSTAKIELSLFDIVEHFNKGASLIDEPAEVEILKQLNIRAAQKALNSSAYKNAGYYYQIACHLMHDDTWEREYEQTFEVYSQWAEAEYMSSNFDKAEELFHIILAKTTSLLDKCKVYQMILIYNENRKRFRDAVDLSVAVINELGITYPHPETITKKDIERQRERFFKHIDELGIEALVQLPTLDNPIHEAAIGTMVSVIVPYWNTYSEALKYLCYEIINLSIELGLCSKASIAFSMIGSILIERSETSDVGYKLASSAIAIAERFEDLYYGTAVVYMFYNHVVFWKRPLRWGLEHLIHSFHTGIEVGNIQWASYCLNHYCMRLLMAGDQLESVKESYDTYTKPMYSLKQDAPLTYFNPPRQTVDNLLGLVDDKTLLKGEAFDEISGIASFYATKQFSAVGLTYTFKLLLYNVLSEFEKAHELVLVENCETYIRANTSQFQPYIGLCFFTISLLRNYNRVSPQKQAQYLKKAETIRDEFEEYCSLNEQNFSMMFYLISAEIYRIKDDTLHAIECYDKVIETSRDNQYLYFEAMANEYCANTWLGRGKERIAVSYLHDAYDLYKRWGCKPKLEVMEREYTFISLKGESSPITHVEKSSVLDIHSVQKATLAISGQIHTEKLLEQLIQIMIESAGAQRGFIILKSENELSIEAGFDIEDKSLTSLFHQKIENSDLVSENIVRYVIRTGEKIILPNAEREGDYTNSRYVKKHKPKSILAMPIILKKRILGALFLENNLATHVFSEMRVELLAIILSQAAISLENAQLFKKSIETQEELSSLRNYLTNIIDSMSSMVIGIDPEGLITLWNKKARLITGLDSKDVVGLPLREAFPRLIKEMDVIKEAILSKEEYHAQRRVQYENGERCYEDLSIFPLIGKGITGAVIRIDDITERIKIEEMMIQSEKMLSIGGLAAGMAHEINNPLGGMMQTADVMSRRLCNSEMPANIKVAEELGISMDLIKKYMDKRKISEMVSRINESGKRAAAIVQNMLSFARKGGETNHLQNVTELVEQCLELSAVDYDLKKRYDFKQIEIVREYDKDLPNVPCEAGKIQQVIMNILRNGAEAMQEITDRNSKFVIRLLHDVTSNSIILEIEDNGPGMPEEIRKRIFEPFFTTKPTDRGTGLGLSVSYFIITDNHCGEMRVESEIGKGSKFIVKLPLKKAE